MDANFWNIVSAVSTGIAAISTAAAAIVAIFAMNSWKKQEKFKSLQRYMMALNAFKEELSTLPKSFTSRNSNPNSSEAIEGDKLRPYAERAFAACSESWVGYSVHGFTNKEKSMWEAVEYSARRYLNGGGADKSEVRDCLNKLLEIKS